MSLLLQVTFQQDLPEVIEVVSSAFVVFERLAVVVGLFRIVAPMIRQPRGEHPAIDQQHRNQSGLLRLF